MIKEIVTRDEFYANHTICPKCKTGDKMKATNIYILTSEARDFKDNLNSAWCENCGWRGRRFELLKEN